MSTPIWQPVTWFVFHHIAKHYKEEYRQHYIDFFETFKTIIPCRICRNHYIENCNQDGLSIQQSVDSHKLFDWTVDLHNTVNRQNNKIQWSYDRANKYYSYNKLTNNLLKLFVIEYMKVNFRKGPEKTNKFMDMLRHLPYVYPYEHKKRKLIDFRERFDLRQDTLPNWVYAFLLLIKNK